MDVSCALQLVILGAGCAAAGYFVGRRVTLHSSASSSASPPSPPAYHGKKDRHEVDHMAEIMDDFKMVLVVRNDLKMGKGKIAAQCSHATLGLYKKVFFRAPKALQRWENCGQVKVVTKVESEDELLLLQAKANSLKVASHVTVDAGRTQIAPNSRTVMSLLGFHRISYQMDIGHGPQWLGWWSLSDLLDFQVFPEFELHVKDIGRGLGCVIGDSVVLEDV